MTLQRDLKMFIERISYKKVLMKMNKELEFLNFVEFLDSTKKLIRHESLVVNWDVENENVSGRSNKIHGPVKEWCLRNKLQKYKVIILR